MTLVFVVLAHVLFFANAPANGGSYVNEQDQKSAPTFSGDSFSTPHSPPLGSYTCSATTCEECLRSNKGCYWCATSGKCEPLSNGGVPNTCTYAEWHDMIYDARSCCAPHSSSYDDCIGDVRVSTCAWCPLTSLEGGKPACVYKFTKELSSRFCKTQPDELFQCSAYKTCRECSKSSMCGWCDVSSTCVTINTRYSMIDESLLCKEITTSCCGDYTTCQECSQQSGPFNKQICLWCPSEGNCKNYETAVKSCASSNRWGVDYCTDRCYIASSSCKACMRVGGCIWIDSYSYTSAGSPIDPGDSKPFCIQGGIDGPKDRAFFYNSSLPGRYTFIPHRYYHLSCTLTATGLINTLIGVAVFVAVSLITALITVTCIKRRKYMALLREALAKDNDVVIDSDEDSDETPFVLMGDIQAVAWE